MILHETCVEYFRRRLAEGWKCISLEGHNAILLSPDGLIRPVDLRNDTLTIRPTANGATIQLTPLAGANWENVDDAPDPDEDATYNYDTEGFGADIYELPNHTTEVGTINSVTAYARMRTTGVIGGRIMIRTHVTLYVGDTETLTGSYATFNKSWVDNPNTTNPWTWAEVDALQAGGQLALHTSGELRLTQVYVEIDYTPPGWSGKISGVTDPAKVMGVDVANIEEVKGVASA